MKPYGISQKDAQKENKTKNEPCIQPHIFKTTYSKPHLSLAPKPTSCFKIDCRNHKKINIEHGELSCGKNGKLIY